MFTFRLGLLLMIGAVLSSCRPSAVAPEPGVPVSLARDRAERISEPRYDLTLTIPSARSEAVEGRLFLSFDLTNSNRDVLLDFSGPAESVADVEVNGQPAEARVESEHVVLDHELLVDGQNTVRLVFRSADDALNRRDEYLYTLLVPAHARSAFPCFDQPDLKGRFALTLDVPATWQAVSNGAMTAREEGESRAVLRFEETLPISTYLFAFAAGAFSEERSAIGDREMRFWHRETDEEKLALNADSLFALHAAAVDWLESYTGTAYPFPKFEFVLLPDFQFGGMEHPGAIFYNASSLLLETSATRSDALARASLIAHETAHMWFGDLVTMRWFDDVWTKEVFANFMAAKIVNPSFPDIDHDLAFYLRHVPAAYAVDRSDGTHAIHQELANLNDAGSLYGAIIYQKAPVVMRQLETLLGEELLQAGLRQYLTTYAFDNASWSDLVEILDGLSPTDLRAWSIQWVESPGRPTLRVERSQDDGILSAVTIQQTNPRQQSSLWPQQIDLLFAYPGDLRRAGLFIEAERTAVPIEPGFPGPDFLLPGAAGKGYALFVLDSLSLRALPEELPDIEEPLLRAVGWQTLWDQVLETRLPPTILFETALRMIEVETDDLLLERILADTELLFWHFVPQTEQDTLGLRLEEALWNVAQRGATASLQTTALRRLASVGTSAETIAALADFWRGELRIERVDFGEEDMSRLALELALRDGANRVAILEEQASRIEDPERRERFLFVRRATTSDVAERDSLYRVLLDPATRPKERWALEALGLIHHPYRASATVDLITPALEVLPEIRQSGTIFFPKRWMDAVLSGHGSPEAARAVRRYLTEHADLPPRLRGKLLQSADLLFRAAGRVE